MLPKGWVSVAIVLTACGSTASVPDSAGMDGQTVADGGVDAAVEMGTDAASCDVGAAPNPLPSITYAWIITGDGGVAPTPAGGDPTGTWVMTHATGYVSPVAATQFDPTMSSITGTGWMALTATTYRIQLDLQFAIDTHAAGIVRQGLQPRGLGTYVVNGTDIVLTPTCTTGTGTGSTLTMVGFSRDSPMSGRMFARGTGGTQLVFDLQVAP